MDELITRHVMFRTLVFPLITYVPLQVAAILMTRHCGWRIVAALPLIPMVPVIYAGFDPDSYDHGSLYGVGLYFVYTPAMVYLAIFCLVGFVITLVWENRESSDIAAESDESPDATA